MKIFYDTPHPTTAAEVHTIDVLTREGVLPVNAHITPGDLAEIAGDG